MLVFVVRHFIRRKGLLAFMPPGLRKLFTEVSFFDILVEVLIYRRLSKMIIAILKPFIQATTPEEAKEMLKSEGLIPQNVYKGLFKKGIMNNFSDEMRSVMLPEGEMKQLTGKKPRKLIKKLSTFSISSNKLLADES